MMVMVIAVFLQTGGKRFVDSKESKKERYIRICIGTYPYPLIPCTKSRPRNHTTRRGRDEEKGAPLPTLVHPVCHVPPLTQAVLFLFFFLIPIFFHPPLPPPRNPSPAQPSLAQRVSVREESWKREEKEKRGKGAKGEVSYDCTVLYCTVATTHLF